MVVVRFMVSAALPRMVNVALIRSRREFLAAARRSSYHFFAGLIFALPAILPGGSKKNRASENGGYISKHGIGEGESADAFAAGTR